MKSIIYAGIGLFSVATMYGVADYYSSQKKGTLDKLYKEQEEMPMETENTAISTTTLRVNVKEANVVNNTTVSKTNKKSKKLKRTIRLEEFSRGKIEEPIMPKPVKKNEEPPVVVKKDLERKLSLDQFSRAPLRNPVKKSESAKISKN